MFIQRKNRRIRILKYSPPRLYFNLRKSEISLGNTGPPSTNPNRSQSKLLNPRSLAKAITNNRRAIIRVCSGPFRRKLKTNCATVPRPGRAGLPDYLLAITRFLSRAITSPCRPLVERTAENRKASSVSAGHVTTAIQQVFEYYNATFPRIPVACNATADKKITQLCFGPRKPPGYFAGVPLHNAPCLAGDQLDEILLKHE